MKIGMKSRWVLGSCLSLGLLCNPASAALVSLGSSFGADTITLDTETGLRWLDLDLTDGRSVEDISSQLGEGGEFEGFRYATVEEVEQLWINAGIQDIVMGAIPPTGDDFTAANLDPVNALIDLLGDTVETPLLRLSEGFTATAPPGDPSLRIVGELNVCVAVQFCLGRGITPNTALASLGPNRDGTDEELVLVGHYLVTEVIPVPPAVWLLGGGLAALGGLGRRERRTAAAVSPAAAQ